MKISKINHVHTKVIVDNEEVKGQLYKHPRNEVDLNTHIDQRIDAARKLYNMYNINNTSKQLRKFSSLLIRKIKSQEKNDLKKEIIKELKEKSERNKKINIHQQQKDLEKGLRKSLKKDLALITEIFSWYCDNDLCLKEIDDPKNQEKIEELIAILQKDYNKEEQKISWIKSIENQNVRVQVDPKSKRLALASYLSLEKDKQEIFELLIQFSKKNEDNEENEKKSKDIKKICNNYVSEYLGDKEKYIKFLADCFSNDLKLVKNKLKDYNQERYDKSKNNKKYLKLNNLLKKEFNRYLNNKNNIKQNKLTYDQLHKMLLTKLMIFLLSKYVDLGKAVYHFCDISNDHCVIKQEYQQGITSFDYELIRANERLAQKLNSSLVFSIHHFSQAILKDDSSGKSSNDLLLMKKDDFYNNIKQGAELSKSVLRFWGGYSEFSNVEVNYAALILEIKEHLYSLRNQNFHYGKGNKKTIDSSNLDKIILKDKARYSKIIFNKYLNNNVFAFFDKEDIKGLIYKLHDKDRYAEKFIPSFNSVFKRNKLIELINQNSIKLQTSERQQYQGALYFLLKEIYYYDFLGNKNLNEYFKQAIKEYSKMIHDVSQDKGVKEPWQHFEATIDLKQSIKDICQSVLIEYSLQNQKNNIDGKTKEIEKKFKHYKLILNNLLLNAFNNFIKDNYKFILVHKNPQYNPEAVKYDYIEDIIGELNEFKKIIQDKQKQIYYEYYVMAKFLQSRQLNFLIGSIEEYLQYVTNIQARHDIIDDQLNNKISNLKSILQVLRFCLVTNGQVSNDWQDYYQTIEQYQKYLKNYTDHPEFYMDNKNPIIYRNIENSRMYGIDQKLITVYENHKIKQKEYNKMCLLKEEIDKILLPNLTKNKRITSLKELGKVYDDKINPISKEEDFKKLREYQNLKEKVELTDLREYSNIIFDLYSILIKLCYFRERDNLYYLLGYYYVNQYWTSEENCSKMIQNIYNAFHHGLNYPIEDKDGKKLCKGNIRITGKKVEVNKWLLRNKYPGINQIENCLFKNSNNDICNQIDHFDYFRKDEHNLLDLYRDVFDFISYDRKLQNNLITRIEENLQRYHLKGKVGWEKQDDKTQWVFKKLEKSRYKTNDGRKQNNNKLKSEDFILKAKDQTGKEIQIKAKAHSEEFCAMVEEMIKYKK